jgi:hypothetical protein
MRKFLFLIPFDESLPFSRERFGSSRLHCVLYQFALAGQFACSHCDRKKQLILRTSLSTAGLRMPAESTFPKLFKAIRYRRRSRRRPGRQIRSNRGFSISLECVVSSINLFRFCLELRLSQDWIWNGPSALYFLLLISPRAAVQESDNGKHKG